MSTKMNTHFLDRNLQIVIIFLVNRMTTILQNQGIQRDVKKRDVEEKTELVVEANDKILERVVSVNIVLV